MPLSGHLNALLVNICHGKAPLTELSAQFLGINDLLALDCQIFPIYFMLDTVLGAVSNILDI